MKIKLDNLKEPELKSKMDELRKELMKQNSQINTGTTSKGHHGNARNIKKNIARIKTKIMEVNKTKA